MKVNFIGETNPIELTHGKTYEVLGIEHGYYRIMDETHDDYLYSPNSFEIIDDSDIDTIQKNTWVRIIMIIGVNKNEVM